jgi:hypothetical protein
LSLTWLAKKKMQGGGRVSPTLHGETTAKLRRNYGETTAKLRRNYGETTAKLRRNYGETTAKLRRNYGETTAKLRRNYGETTAKLRRNYGETTAKLRRNYGETTAKLRQKLFRATETTYKPYYGETLKVRLMLRQKGTSICIERATSMQQRGGKGVGGVPGSASIFSSRALRS